MIFTCGIGTWRILFIHAHKIHVSRSVLISSSSTVVAAQRSPMLCHILYSISGHVCKPLCSFELIKFFRTKWPTSHGRVQKNYICVCVCNRKLKRIRRILRHVRFVFLNKLIRLRRHRHRCWSPLPKYFSDDEIIANSE